MTFKTADNQEGIALRFLGEQLDATNAALKGVINTLATDGNRLDVRVEKLLDINTAWVDRIQGLIDGLPDE
jgi:hypothetical protein